VREQRPGLKCLLRRDLGGASGVRPGLARRVGTRGSARDGIRPGRCAAALGRPVRPWRMRERERRSCVRRSPALLLPRLPPGQVQSAERGDLRRESCSLAFGGLWRRPRRGSCESLAALMQSPTAMFETTYDPRAHFARIRSSACFMVRAQTTGAGWDAARPRLDRDAIRSLGRATLTESLSYFCWVGRC
jgi:hypothetical protein